MKNFLNRIDKSSPVPIYHQIAEAIRWQISTGQLKSGDELPPTREGAALWEVNRHTIRRAYQELVAKGLVEPRGTSRMVVAKQREATPKHRNLNSFIDRVCKNAKDTFGLSPIELAALLHQNDKLAGKEKITVVECNHYQCFDLKRQLEQRFDVAVSEFLLDSDGEPGPGPIVGTLFHSNEICARWPGRRDEMQFGGLYVNSELAGRVLRCCTADKRLREVVVFSKRHETDAFNLATDLQMALHGKNISVVPAKRSQSIEALLKRGKVVAVAPWNWDELDEQIRQHTRCFLLQYCLDPVDIESFGERFKLPGRGKPVV